ncbi:MAG: chorismate mutase [Candidatus Bathyarchaeota archaeon]|nr:chorismate mutase [Candidatus Termiticorpusculum sp.]
MEDIQTLRKRVDEIDDQIIKALSERITICRKIGEHKKQQGLPVQDQIREREVYNKVKDKAAKFQLEPARIEALYHEIVNMCSDIQK